MPFSSDFNLFGATDMQCSMLSSLRNLQLESCVSSACCFIAWTWNWIVNPLFWGGTDGMGCVWAVEPATLERTLREVHPIASLPTVNQIDRTEKKEEKKTHKHLSVQNHTSENRKHRFCQGWPMTNQARSLHLTSHLVLFGNVILLFCPTYQATDNPLTDPLGCSQQELKLWRLSICGSHKSHYKFSFCIKMYFTWDQLSCWKIRIWRVKKGWSLPTVTYLVSHRGQPRITIFSYLSHALSTMYATVLLPYSKILQLTMPKEAWNLVSGCLVECTALHIPWYLCGLVLLATVKMETLGRNLNHYTFKKCISNNEKRK